MNRFLKVRFDILKLYSLSFVMLKTVLQRIIHQLMKHFFYFPFLSKKAFYYKKKRLQLNVLGSTKRLHCLVKGSICIYCKVPEAVLYCYKHILLENSIVSYNILRRKVPQSLFFVLVDDANITNTRMNLYSYPYFDIYCRVFQRFRSKRQK